MSRDLERVRARAVSVFTEASREIAAFSTLAAVDDAPLLRSLTYLLRHGATASGLDVDPEGWADLRGVAQALRSMDRRFRKATARTLAELVREREVERFEVMNGQIRALYGHSLPGVVAARVADPPSRLFLGTAEKQASSIHASGLQPNGRGFVHLTSDLGYAAQVARATGDAWLVLRVDSGRASEAGTEFRTAAGHVWLAREVRPEFIDPLPVARG